MFFHTLSLSLRHGMRTIFDQSLTALIASVPNVARIFLKKAVEEKDFPVFIQILTRQEDILSNNGQDLRSILNGMIGIIFSDKLDQSPKSKGIKACIERQISKRITQHFFKFLKINEKFFLNLPLPLGAKLTIQQALLATVKSAEYAANNVTSHIVKMLSDEDIRFFEWQIAQKEEFLEWVHNEAYQKEEKERRVIVDAKCLGWREVVNIIWAKWGQEIIRNKYLREKTLSSIISGNRYLFDFIAHNYSGFYKWLYDDEQFLIYVCANFEEKKIKLHEIFEVIAKDLVKDQNILPTICNLIENCQVELLQQICMAGINCIKWKDTRNQGVLNWLCDRANQNRFWDAREKLKLLFNCFKKEIEQDEEVIKELRKYKKSQSNVKQLLLECKINLP
jgi:hypothetical protein